MELSDYTSIARRWWWLAGASVVLSAFVGYAFSQQMTPRYQATATLLVIDRAPAGSVRFVDLEASARLASTFSELIKLRPVLDQAIATGGFSLSSDELDSILSITNPADTQLLRVTATAQEPMLAAQVANTVAEVFVTSNEAQLASRPGVASVVELARAPSSPSTPGTSRNVALAGVLGLIASAAIVILFEYVDDSVRTRRQVVETTGLDVLGHLTPPRRNLRRLRARGAREGDSFRPDRRGAEGYRTLRTRLLQALPGTRRLALLVTSAGPQEGATMATAQLGIAFAAAGLSTVVVDADLRGPKLHSTLHLDNGPGLASLLRRHAGIEDSSVLVETAQEGLWLLPAGERVPSAAELLSSEHTAVVIDQLRNRFDVILVNSPPVTEFSDAAITATHLDGSIIIVRAGRTRRPELAAAAEDLSRARQPVLGVAIIGAEPGGISMSARARD